MSNKTAAPKLRFPEFQDAPEWEKQPLAIVANVIAGQSPDGSNYNDKRMGMPFYQGKTDFGDVYINKPTKWTTQVTKIAESGDILMSVRAPVGALNICTDQICIGRGLAAIQAKQNKWYLYYFLNSIQRFIVGNGGAIFDSINKDQIEKIATFIPDIPEQQKIADCLTSLDDLIAAQSQKVETLQAYKKGLLQNLFPAEGESVPRLRFPEFQSAGGWETKEFSEYIVLYRGSSPRPIQEYLTKSNNGVNWIKIGDTKNADNYVINQVEEKITPKGAEKSRKVSSGELILANSMSFGKTYQLAIDGYIYDGWFVLREYKEHFYKPFLLQLLNSEYMQNQYIKLSAGGIVLNISSDIVYSTILPHTSLEEQQRIAELLTALDEQISAQGEALAALKVHKKGLMQGLFPNQTSEVLETSEV
ncbi:MAG TPA: restriction endonuclease subunit S [Anaerolineales bacterium]|nr:restriction endonuclease subunit S [Anaerolineales bacterium]